MTLSRKQWLTICLSIGSLGAMIASLPNWHEAITPAFIGAAILNLATHISGLFTDDPRRPNGHSVAEADRVGD